MTYTQEQLQHLIDIRARGVLTTRDADGRTVTYQSASDLDKAIADAKRDLAAAAGVQTRRYGSFSRG